MSVLAVAGLHALLLAVLLAQHSAPRAVVPALFAIHILPARPAAPPPAPTIQPMLTAPPMTAPMPGIVLAPPTRPAASHAITQAPPAAHAGAGSDDAGLDLDIGGAQGGGAASRGSLASFEAAVRRRILAEKRQPSLAWDRRNTCVVGYTVTVTRAGSLAGLHIDPCAVPEINQAAGDAIRAAAPFPPPPDLGTGTYAVQGSLVFKP